MFVAAAHNRIGTDATGAAALGNAGHGILASRVHQLGLQSNLVSANGGSGIVVRDTFSPRLLPYPIEANLSANQIGTNKAGTAALGNVGHGVELINAANVTVGGPNPLIYRGNHPFEVGWTHIIPPGTMQNLISGNGGHGLYVASSGTAARPSNIRIINNLIGSAISEQATLGNGGSGVYLAGVVGATVGGTHYVSPPGPWIGAHPVGNVISGNARDGVTIANLGATPSRDNVVERNTIGRLPRALTGRFGNAGWGVAIINSSGNRVGGSGAATRGNSIVYNGRGGILVRSDGAPANQNRLGDNSILANGGPGIDLQPAPGTTPNDPGDGDEGANGLQNFPLITGIARAAATTYIHYRVNSTPSRTLLIKLFASRAADPGGYGQGETFLGSSNVTTDPLGNGSGVLPVPSSFVTAGSWLTATATDRDGNTSEFSPAVSATSARPVYRPPDRARASLVTAHALSSVVHEPTRRDPLTPRGLLT
jgi:titin